MRYIKTALCLLCSLACAARAVVPTVIRRLSAAQVGPESVIRVTLEVTLPSVAEVPKVWLLTESWPSGWSIRDAKWNGVPYPETMVADTLIHGWLFGDEDTPPVAAGTMTYLLAAPAQVSSSAAMNTASGVAFSYNDSQCIAGAETLRPDEYAQLRHFTLPIRPGWSLMAMPYEPDAVGRELLEGLSDAMAGFDGEAFAIVRSVLPSMGMPFWLHSPWEEEVVAEFVAATLEELPEPLRAAGPVRHQQWNLFGVCGDDPVRLASDVVAWRWGANGRYERCEQNAILQPGEAVWLFVE